MLWQFLICESLCKWWVTTADNYLPSVFYLYDSFFSRYVTPQMKNSSVMLLAGWFLQLFRTFCECNRTSYLHDLSVSEQWSPVLAVAVTHHLQRDLRLLLIICRVTVYWETATACFFRIKTWKWHQKGIKICSGSPKFFRSISWIPLKLFSKSWHFPFKPQIQTLTIILYGWKSV